MNKKKSVEWTFLPQANLIMRLEAVCVSIIALLLFILSYANFHQVLYASLFTVLYLGIYFLVSYFIKTLRNSKETYSLTPTHLEITRSSRFSNKYHKFKVSDITRHKLDHTFLGGYLLTDKQKHLLFFNTSSDLQKYETFITKHHPTLSKKRKE